MRAAIATLVLSLSVLNHARADRTIYVNAALSGGANDGTSWANAYRGRLGLQAAMTASGAGDEIWVAQGIYAPAGTNGARSASFAMRSGVGIYGGFIGDETVREQRDAAVRTTTLTGDLNSNGSSGAAASENSFHVVVAASVDALAVLDGFTITGGVSEANSTTLADSGGGVQLIGGSQAVIRACRFALNRAGWQGGDITIVDSGPLLESCVFVGSSFAKRGLAVSIGGDSPATVRACSFIGSPPTTGGMAGIGIYADSTSSAGVTVEGCEFSITTVPFSCPAGVGIHATANSRLTVRSSRFVNNLSCGGGGGIHCDGLGTIERCVFVGNEGQFDGGAALFSFQGETTVTDSIFVGNDRAGFSTVAAHGVMHFVNCTFASNGNTNAAHFVVNTSGTVGSTFENCVIWGNMSSLGDASAVVFDALNGGTRFDSCLVQAWNGTLPGTNSFAADPLFVSVAGLDGVLGTIDDDLRLSAGSPAIDRGNNNLLLTTQALDLDGLPRRRDDPSSPDAGVGTAPLVDLGAYEHRPLCPADFDGDGFATGDDFDAFVADFELGGMSADFDADGFVTGDDFDAFVAAFEAGC